MSIFIMLKKLLNSNKLRVKLFLYFMVTIILMGSTIVYPLYIVNKLMEQMSTTFEMNVKLNNLNKTLNELDYVYNDYLTSKNSRSLDLYYKYFYELKKEVKSIKFNYVNIQNMLMMKNIKNMIENYLKATDNAVMLRRGRAVAKYQIHLKESTKIYQYIYETIYLLNNSLFLQNTDSYISIKKSFYIIENYSVLMLIFGIIINILLILWFTYKITRPITELSVAANEISRGNYEVNKIKVEYDDEIGVLAEAFNQMIVNISEYISEIKEKAMLENKLKEQELNNAMMKSHLKEAELLALQSQINPHFLFNTLNAGAQIAMMEGANRACTFIEHAADLFRYNIRNLENPVTIWDEIKNIESYIHLLKERFADKIEFSIIKDESIMNAKIPCLILQPIVENAFVHGLGDVEYTGRVWVEIIKKGENVIISIKDNGKGMPSEIINEIVYGEFLNKNENNFINKGQVSGIGLKNIISRLKIFYNITDVMEIYSEMGHGTQIVLHLPIV